MSYFKYLKINKLKKFAIQCHCKLMPNSITFNHKDLIQFIFKNPNVLMNFLLSLVYLPFSDIRVLLFKSNY